MRFFVFASLTLLVPALAAPAALKTVETYAGDKKADSYIITLKDGVSKDTHLTSLVKQLGQGDKITNGDWDSKFLNGFSAKLGPKALNYLRAHPDVASIAEDGIMSISTTQTNAPWGLRRISQRAPVPGTSTTALTYSYDYTATGSGVDVYVVDTGIYTEHSGFGGRARWGATFGGYADADGNGHGTHCAGTVGSSQFGVAKDVSLIAVKVLSDAGSGSTADIISGLGWVLGQALASGRPSVVSMSLGGGASTPLDTAVKMLTAGGIHVIVAAGNSAVDAQNTSPAREPSAITVGASTISDTIASYSNYGSVVDIFAPGTGITSTWIGSPTAINNISGTSMATPHVAGLVAYLISCDKNVSPAEMSKKIKDLSTKDALSGIPPGTVNYLAFNGITA